jgi:hypothetical protein
LVGSRAQCAPERFGRVLDPGQQTLEGRQSFGFVHEFAVSGLVRRQQDVLAHYLEQVEVWQIPNLLIVAKPVQQATPMLQDGDPFARKGLHGTLRGAGQV